MGGAREDVGGVIAASDVSAALVTRGDVDLSEILASIADAGISDVHLWDNSQREDVSCFGRFLAAECAQNPFVYMQDDDLVAPIRELLAEYDPARDFDTVVANKPAGEEWRFLGCGALMHRDLPRGFEWSSRYLAAHAGYGDFCRVADVVFLYSLPYRSVDLGHRNLPWGYHTPENPRMYGAPDHIAVRERARDRTLTLTGVTA
jgi:hypothetical protein